MIGCFAVPWFLFWTVLYLIGTDEIRQRAVVAVVMALVAIGVAHLIKHTLSGSDDQDEDRG